MIVLIVKIILMFMAIIFVMVFSGGETAIASLEYRGVFTEEKFSEKGKSIISTWRQFPWRILNTVLIGNNLFVIMVSVLAVSASSDFSRITNIPAANSALAFSSTAAVLVFVFSEMFPKIIARFDPLKFFKTIAPFLWFFDKIILPINKIFSKQMFWISDLFGVKIKDIRHKISNHDVQEILDIGEADGTIKSEEKDIINAIIEFGDIMVKDIMLPRARMDCLDINNDLETIIDRVNKLKHSRLPVFEGAFDNIIGLIYTKDLLIAWQNRDLIIVRDLIRPVYFIPPTKKVSELLREFKEGHQHLAIVVDEFDTVQGLVTIEDVIEEIVGDILDEYDVDETIIKPLEKGSFLVDPSIELDVLDKRLKLNLEESVPDDVRTLSGYIMFLLGRLPKTNEVVTKDNVSFLIKEMHNKVIKKVILHKKK